MRVIGIIGLAGHGKDTAGNWFIAQGWQRIGFADALYREVGEAYGKSIEWLGRREFKEIPTKELSLKNCANTEFVQLVQRIKGISLEAPLSPREVLQMWGTEYRREYGNRPNYWLEKVAEALNDKNNYVVTDVRFLNEAQAVKDWGGQILKVTRPEYAIQSNGHASETSLAQWVPDFAVSNDSTIEALHAKLTTMF